MEQSTPVDFIARIATAWDGRGSHTFAPYAEHAALCALARLQASCSRLSWAQLSTDQRHAIVLAARRAVDLGRQCAWAFGEGRGA